MTEKQLPRTTAEEEVELAKQEESAGQEVAELIDEETSEAPAESEEAEVPTPEDEAKKPEKKKKGEEDEIVEERIYTIPLAKAWIRPPKKRAPRAMHMIRNFITKHMKLEMRVEEEEEGEMPTLVLSREVNERVWSKGIEKPPRKIRVRAAKDKEGNVTVYLAEGA
jgi:large subunit ribosomal protein L31e